MGSFAIKLAVSYTQHLMCILLKVDEVYSRLDEQGPECVRFFFLSSLI